MKIKTPFLNLEFEIIFIITFLSFLFSNTIKKVLLSYYICYLFIIFHELSHVFVAAIFNKEINSFKFSVSGVCISFNKINRIGKVKEILIYLAGPISNLILAIIFSYNKMIYEINIGLFIVNLLPIYPLDGYNILDNLLRGNKHDKKRKIILEKCSKTVLVILFFLGILNYIKYKNISIIIFCTYIIILNITSKSEQQLYQILSNIGY